VAAISGASISVSGAVTAAGAVTFSATNLSINIGTSQTTGSITLGGTSQTGFITIGQSTASQTANISTGATGTGNTKTINVGVGGLAGSTTTIAIGPVTATTAAGTVTFNTATTVAIANTGGSALSVAGNITGGNVLGGANVNATTHTGTTVSVTGNITGGNVISAALNGTGNVTITSTAANAWVFLTPTGTGTIQVNTDITNGQANGVGNIGNATGYFNTVFAKATSAQYADLAEIYAADQEYLPGTVLSFGGNKEVTMSDVYSDNRVAGVVSTNPSYVMNSVMSDPYATAVALTGRVPTSVTGQVRKGDMMISHGDGTATACSQPAMGTVIGKALEDFAGTSGMIEIVVGRL
jgi:hypothetical protein